MKRELVAVALVVGCGGPSKPTKQVDESQGSAKPGIDVSEGARPRGNPRTKGLIPRAALFGNPERTNVKLSPDGRYVSWLAPKDGVMNIFVAPANKIEQGFAVTNDTKRPISRYAWAYTNKHVVYAQDAGGDENFHVFRTDITDGSTVDLTPFENTAAEVVASDPQQPTKLLVKMNDREKSAMDVHEVDIVTGKRALVVKNDQGFGTFVADHAMRVRIGVKSNEAGGNEIHLLGPDKKWRLFDTIPLADAMDVLGFAPGDRAVYVRDARGRNTAALVTIDLATKKAKVLAEDAKADAPIDDAAITQHPTKHHFQGVVFEYEKPVWKVLDPAIAKDIAAIEKLGGATSIVSRTLDDKKWVVAVDSDQKPGRYYLWDRAAQKETLLFATRPLLEQAPLVKMHPVVIDSRDGLQLVSYLSLPVAADPDGDGKADRPVPMILWVHGGPWARDRWGFNALHQLFANRGYAVLAVNFRGSTGFGKQFVNAADLQWGKAMHDDLLDAVAWAVKAGVAPKDQICIGGGSYGGYATLVGLAMTPDVFACGVDVVGISNITTVLASIPPYWKHLRAEFYARMGNPETPEGKAMLLDRSPITHAKRIKRPLLIGQGANDPRVKKAESDQIVGAMKDNRLPVTYVLFPDEGHGFKRPQNNVAFWAVTEAFLSAHLGGVYEPISKAEVSASTMQVLEGKTGIPGLP